MRASFPGTQAARYLQVHTALQGTAVTVTVTVAVTVTNGAPPKSIPNHPAAVAPSPPYSLFAVDHAGAVDLAVRYSKYSTRPVVVIRSTICTGLGKRGGAHIRAHKGYILFAQPPQQRRQRKEFIGISTNILLASASASSSSISRGGGRPLVTAASGDRPPTSRGHRRRQEKEVERKKRRKRETNRCELWPASAGISYHCPFLHSPIHPIPSYHIIAGTQVRPNAFPSGPFYQLRTLVLAFSALAASRQLALSALRAVPLGRECWF